MTGEPRTPEGARFRLDRAGVSFGPTVALDAVDLAIAPGEAVALVGPSGAGKTTLLRLLNGTLRPTRGRVEVDGRPLATASLAELREVRAGIGFVHQDLSLIPNLRVLHNVLAGRLGRLSLFGAARRMLVPVHADVQRVHQLLERVGIPEKLYQPTHRLSGGQRQRVAIARALFQEPSALLADEPVSSVDPARARDTVELLLAISRERGLTLVMSLHNLGLARELFPRLVGIRSGGVVFDGDPSTVGGPELDALYDLSAEEMLCEA